jgi:hypothetical protein
MVESINVRIYSNEYGCVDLNPIKHDLHNFIYETNQKNIIKNRDKINKFISKETRNLKKKGYGLLEISNSLEVNIHYSRKCVNVGIYATAHTDHSKGEEHICSYDLYYNSSDNSKDTNKHGTIILDYIKSKESSMFYGGVFKTLKRRIKDCWGVCITILGYLTLISILYNIYLRI